MEIEFYGAAGRVTGSCHIVRAGDHRLLVDCGLIQGSRRAEAENAAPFPFDPASIDAVVLTHAHVDHSGRLPLLFARGYDGPVWTHRASRDLCRILLADSASLHERDVAHENRRRERKGLAPIAPLYGLEDAMAVIGSIRTLAYETPREILPGLTLTLRDAGHIMGSASAELAHAADGAVMRALVSGDLGQYGTPILRDPVPPPAADLVVLESTYGDRLHRDRDATIAELGEILGRARHDRGNVLIPSFAVGRSQELLYLLGRHYEEWNLDRWQIFLDSPMAIEAGEVYWDHAYLHDEEATALRERNLEMPALPNLKLTRSAAESRAINCVRTGAIVIAGSGMCNGGRIVHHLKHNLWRKECHVVMVGWQAEGSLGRRLVDGQAYVSIHGEAIRVAAAVHTVGGLSAHGDRNDLLRWYRAIPGRPPVRVVHGEPAAAAALAAALRAAGADAEVAAPGQRVQLTQVKAAGAVPA